MKPTPKPTWQDRVRQVNEFHVERLKEDPNWTLQDTARELRRALGSVSEDLLLASWLKTHPKIEKFKRAYEALEFVRAKKREMRLAL